MQRSATPITENTSTYTLGKHKKHDPETNNNHNHNHNNSNNNNNNNNTQNDGVLQLSTNTVTMMADT